MWNTGSRMLDLQTSRNYKQCDAVAIIKGKVETRLFVLLQLSPFSIEGTWEPTKLVEDRTSWHAFVNCFLLRVLDESFRRISENPDELNLDYAHNFDHSVAVRAAEYFAERMSSLLASHDTERTRVQSCNGYRIGRRIFVQRENRLFRNPPSRFPNVSSREKQITFERKREF